jgi:hypothetical protein
MLSPAKRAGYDGAGRLRAELDPKLPAASLKYSGRRYASGLS